MFVKESLPCLLQESGTYKANRKSSQCYPSFIRFDRPLSRDKTLSSEITNMQLTRSTLLPLTALLSQVHGNSTTCKSTPKDASWPSLSQWTSLNNTLSGRLLHPLPPASACHSSYHGSNETCSEITTAWGTFAFHQDNPVSTAWNNANNDSCLPDASVPCSETGYPVYVVNASSANDVKLAVDFARQNNIRLNVKASGHDFLKRYVISTAI